jgi:hypothetical protein
MLDRRFLFVGFCSALTVLAPVEARAQAARLLAPATPTTTSSATDPIAPVELQQFVQAVKQLQLIEMESQKQMAAVIKKEGLSPERFVEIDRSYASGVAPAKPISEDEQRKYNAITLKIQKVWQDTQPKRERAISGQGLTVARFSEINARVRSDRSLQEKVRQMIGGNAS